MNISLTCILLLLSASTFGATYFVRTNGNDSTGDGSTGNPWRTISKANSTVAANDTVLLGDGAYLEHTTVTKPLTFRAESTKGGPQTRGMRLQTNVVLDGINFRWFGDAQLNWGGSWAASVRLDTAAHNSIITNCVFGPSMHVATTNFTFIPGSPTNAIMKFFAGNYYYLGAPARTDTPGDYRFHSTSFAQRLSNGSRGLWVLPYDIFGMVRGPYDPPGAVVGGKSPNLGGF